MSSKGPTQGRSAAKKRRKTNGGYKEVTVKQSGAGIQQIGQPSRLPLLVPKSKKVRLRYPFTVTVNPNASVAGHVFRANDLRDPDFTGAGDQPNGFDQWMAFYNHFTVIGSQLVAAFIQPSSTAIPNIVGIKLQDSSTVETNLLDQIGDPRCHWDVSNTVSNSTSVVKMQCNYSAKKFHGVKDVLDNDDLQGDTGASPTEAAYYVVWAGPPDQASDSATVYITGYIEYLAILQEPKDLGRS